MSQLMREKIYITNEQTDPKCTLKSIAIKNKDNHTFVQTDRETE